VENRKQAIIAMLKDPDAAVREAAAGVLDGIESLQAVDELIEASRVGQRSHRVRSIFALERVNTPAVFKTLLELLDDPEPDIRVTSVRVLGRKKHPKTIGSLIKKLQDEDASVRVYAVEALSEFNEPRLLPYFVKILQAKDPLLVCGAIRGLAALGAKEAEEPLLKMLKHPEAQVRKEAVLAFEKLEV